MNLLAMVLNIGRTEIAGEKIDLGVMLSASTSGII